MEELLKTDTLFEEDQKNWLGKGKNRPRPKAGQKFKTSGEEIMCPMAI